MEVDRNFVEFFGLLTERRVKFLIVGGYAVNYYGYPRYTGDIDIWLRLDEANVELAVRAVEDFGFAALGLQPEDLNRPYQVLQLGYEPARIDILTTVDGVDFESCYAAATRVEIDEYDVPFISLADLLRAKRATGRAKDLADVEGLEKRGYDPSK